MDESLHELIELIHFTEDVSARIHGVLDEAEIYRIVLEEFAGSEQYGASIVLLTDDAAKLRVAGTSLAPGQLKAGAEATGLRLKGLRIDLDRSSIYSQVVREGKTLHVKVNDILSELFPQPLVLLISRVMGYEKKTSILTPLQRHGEGVGAFAMTSTELAEHLVPSVRNLGRHISRALEIVDEEAQYRRAEEALRRQRDELAARNAILSATLRTSDLDELLYLILDEVLAFLGTRFASIHLLQADQVVLRAWRGLSAAFRAQTLSFPADDLPDWMRELYVVHEHLDDGGALPPFAKDEGLQAWASVPLRLPARDDGEGAWLGTLMMGCRRYEALSEDEVRALQAMSDQLALAIEHTRTYRQAQERLIRLQTLHNIDRAIIQRLDLHDILQVILERVPEDLGADAAAISLLDEDQLRPLVFAMRLVNGTFVEEQVFDLAEGLLHWFVERQEPVVIYDLTQDPRVQMHRERIRNGPLISYLGVPLVSHDRTIGILHIMATKPRVFADEDVAFFRTMAGQVAIAIENARLYEAIKQELTERKQAEEALRKAHNELERRVEERTAELAQVNAELIRASRLKDEFLANMSHELRTPLNAILGLSEALQEEVYGTLHQRQRKPLRTIEQSGRHLLALINDILDVARIEAGEAELEIGPVAVESVCQASLGLVRQVAHKKQLRISLNVDSALTTIQADERRLKQILVNLLSNAVKFTSEGGAIGLDVVGDAQREAVHFTVWDSGIGISPQEMPRLFQPFVQLDSSLARQHTGTGLGLALVRHLAELHGGGVAVESEGVPGQGSRFTVSLPWRGDDGETRGQRDKEMRSPLPPVTLSPSHPVTILLAEDNEANIDTLSGYLQSRGYQVIVARNGVEAIQQARQARPDLILMDIQMPGLDGLEATRHIRADVVLAVASIPIIALTALAMPGDRERCLAVGANEYLSKPVSLKGLVEAIEAQLQG